MWCGVGATPDLARQHVADGMQAFYQLPYERFERWSPAGTPEQIAEQLLPYVAAGCSVFNLIVQGASADDEVDAAGEIRRHLLAATA